MAKPVSVKEIHEFLKETCACIINGGNTVYLTKNLIDGNIAYIHTTALNLAQYSFAISGSSKVLVDVDDKKAVKKLLKTKKKKDRCTLKDILEAYKHEIMYERAVFEPYVTYSGFLERTNSERVFNLFTGFHAQLNDGLCIDMELISPLLWHMQHILCNGNVETYEYLLNWLAHLCQTPNKKIGVMIALMSSQQGAGKNVFWDFIGNYVVGKGHYMVLNDLDQVTGKFNMVMENKILTVCDEIGNFGGAHRSNDKLKNIITQGEQIIERKGFDAIRVNDYNTFVGLSNNDWPWKIEAGDRRHLVLEVSNEKVGNKAYFTRLTACMNNTCGTHFYNMLLRRDISCWNREEIPVTQFKRDLKLMSAHVVVRYMIDCLSRSIPYGFNWTDAGPTSVFSVMLYEGFLQWQRMTGDDREKISQTSFTQSLNRHLGLGTSNVRMGGQRKRGVRIDRQVLLAKIRTYLKDPDFEIHDDM